MDGSQRHPHLTGGETEVRGVYGTCSRPRSKCHRQTQNWMPTTGTPTVTRCRAGRAGGPQVTLGRWFAGWAASAAWGLGNNRAWALLGYSARRPWGLQQRSGDQDPLQPENPPLRSSESASHTGGPADPWPPRPRLRLWTPS